MSHDSNAFREYMQRSGRTQYDHELAEAFEAGRNSGQAEREGQEPVGFQWLDTGHFRKKIPDDAIHPSAWRPLYTTPPAAPAIPQGWRLVPEEPTPEIIGAMAVAWASGTIDGAPTLGMCGAMSAYESMLAAAPQPHCAIRNIMDCTACTCDYPREIK